MLVLLVVVVEAAAAVAVTAMTDISPDKSLAAARMSIQAHRNVLNSPYI